MRTAFVKVWIKERELSAYVESLRYERTDEKDDYVNIRFKSDYAVNLIDDPDFYASQTIRFQYGFLGQIPSPIHITKISEIKVDYRGFIMLELKCLDNGNTMKKGNSDIHWKGSADSIVKAIADKYGMETALQEKHTYQTYQSLPQTFKSDFDLLRYLAKREGFETYVSSNTLHFKTADLGKKAVRLFTYGQNIHALSIELRTAHKKKAASATINSTINPYTKGLEATLSQKGEQIKTELSQQKLKGKDANDMRSAMADLNASSKAAVSDLNERSKFWGNIDTKIQEDAALALNRQLEINKGDYKKTWKELSPEFKQAFGTDDMSRFNFQIAAYGVNKGKIVRIKAFDKDFNQNASAFESSADSKEAKKKILTGTIEIELDTSFNLGDIVTLTGVAKRHSGNWFVHQIEDKISGSGPAMTRLTITRSASNGDYIGGSDKNTNINTSVGKDGQSASKLKVDFKSNGVLKAPTISDQVF